jgi:hypothetical protein
LGGIAVRLGSPVMPRAMQTRAPGADVIAR